MEGVFLKKKKKRKTLKLKSFSKESKRLRWFIYYDICAYSFLFQCETCEMMSNGQNLGGLVMRLGRSMSTPPMKLFSIANNPGAGIAQSV
jgi:hypothetical protein